MRAKPSQSTFFCLTTLTLLLATTPACAQDAATLVAACESPDPAKSLPACTSIITGGDQYGAYLFEAYNNRAVAELAIGQANATLFTAVFPLIGLLAAIFILPEVYGFDEH